MHSKRIYDKNTQTWHVLASEEDGINNQDGFWKRYLIFSRVSLYCITLSQPYHLYVLDTPPSSIESLHVTSPMDTSTLPPNSQPQITVIEGTKIQDLAPPPDLTSDIVLQNEINHYQKQKAKQKTVSLKVEDEGKLSVFIKNSYLIPAGKYMFKVRRNTRKRCEYDMIIW